MADIVLEAAIDLNQLNRQLRNARLTGLTNGLRDAERQGSRLNRTLGSTGGLIRGVGTALAAAGLVRGFTSVVSATTDFDTAIRRVSAVSGAAGPALEELSEQARELGASTRFSATQVAEAQAFLGQAGFATNEILASTPGLLALAAAGQLDLGRAADIASNVLSGFNLEATETGRVSDVLASAAASSNTNVEQLGNAFKFIAPVAAGLGISLEESAAAIGVLSDAGIQGSMAGTVLRSALLRLVDPPKEAASAMEAAGIAVNDAMGNFIGIEPVIDQVRAAMEAGTATTADLANIFGTEAVSGVLALVSAGGRIGELTDTLSEAEGAAQMMSDTLSSGPEGAILSFQSAIEGLQIAIGQSGLIDVFVGVTESITSFVRQLTDLIDGDLTLSEFFRNLIGSPEDVANSFSDTYNAIVDSISGFISSINWSDAGDNLANFLIDAITGIDWGEVIRTGFNAAVGLAEFFTSFFGGLLRTAFNGVIGLLESTLNSVTRFTREGTGSSVIPDLGPFTIPRLASGGYVRGPGSATSDSIPALLSNGEFVINAGAASTLGSGVLEQLNRGRLPQFQRGGSVGNIADDNFAENLERAVRQSFSAGIKDAIQGSGGLREILSSTFDTIADRFAGRAADQLTDSIFNGISSLFSGGFGGAGGGFGSIFSGLFGGFFQDGGIVPGSGPVPIIAHGGEVVLNQQQQRDLLNSRNQSGNINVTVNALDARSFDEYVMSPRARESLGNAINANDRDRGLM